MISDAPPIVIWDAVRAFIEPDLLATTWHIKEEHRRTQNANAVQTLTKACTALAILFSVNYFAVTYAPWHFLYFFPLPQGQGSLRPTLADAV